MGALDEMSEEDEVPLCALCTDEADEDDCIWDRDAATGTNPVTSPRPGMTVLLLLA